MIGAAPLEQLQPAALPHIQCLPASITTHAAKGRVDWRSRHDVAQRSTPKPQAPAFPPQSAASAPPTSVADAAPVLVATKCPLNPKWTLAYYRLPSAHHRPAAPTVRGGLHRALTIRRSIHRDHLACLECGFAAQSLRRHLTTAHGLTPDQYRAKWKLSPDYPMVAPDYSEHRSVLAKRFGLGRKRKLRRASGRRAQASKRTRPAQVQSARAGERQQDEKPICELLAVVWRTSRCSVGGGLTPCQL